MEQLSFLLTWRDEQFVVAMCQSGFECAPDPQMPGSAKWFETKNAAVAEDYLRRNGPMWLDYGKKYDVPLTIYSAGRFVCIRRLKHGPIKKLSMWDQMEAGDEILLHPEPTDADIRFATARAGRLHRQGRKNIQPWVRESDGTLWLKCLP